MSALAALDREFRARRSRFDELDNNGELAASSRRLGEMMSEIAVTPPATIGDCIVKLRLLADPDLGINAGDRDDDVTSLRQVIAFLAAISP